MEQIQELLNWVTGSGIGLTDVIGILSIIATITPTPVDDGVLAVLRKVLNLGAMNFGQSENLKKPGRRSGPPGK